MKGLMRSGVSDSTLPPLPRAAPSIAPTAFAFALASPDFCAASTCLGAAAILFDQALQAGSRTAAGETAVCHWPPTQRRLSVSGLGPIPQLRLKQRSKFRTKAME